MNTQTYPSDRRRNPRQRPAKCEVRIVCQRGELFLGPNLAESLADASEEGLGIVVREALRVGERVSLSLDGVAPRVQVQRLGRVDWCDPAEDGLFRAGVEMDTPLEYAELMSLSTT
jgi:hypothetical protein